AALVVATLVVVALVLVALVVCCLGCLLPWLLAALVLDLGM
ncbi:hypothetical protein Tco_0718084, partial [Tanacetum coccineum]